MSTPLSIGALEPGKYVLPERPEYASLGSSLGDRRDGRVYRHDERIRTAVRVAIATGRPLLLQGAAGSGKSSLAPFVARALSRRFYSVTVTARMQARDLMWEFDALRRLNDAQLAVRSEAAGRRVERLENYIEPRELWWAFDAGLARRRAAARGEPLDVPEAVDPGVGPPVDESVVLIDEIDKADPDVPNSLLEALGSLQFTIAETGRTVRARRPPLVMITTNNERELPAAFRRRCAVLFLPEHHKAELVEIAGHHLGDADTTLFEAVADQLQRFRAHAEAHGQRAPSTAEYLDAVRACRDLGIRPDAGNTDWAVIEQILLAKQDPFAPKKP